MRSHETLSGITVVSLEQAVAAPYATRLLTDLGARVIKVERRDMGDFARDYDGAVNGTSSYFAWLNRSKESITLDLKSPHGMEVLERLLAMADVYVQNLGPGAALRLNVAPGQVTDRHPGLVACAISGFGTDGPWADRRAYDLIAQAEAGVLSVTGLRETPCKVGFSVADISAGMFAFSSILAALIRRRVTGSGDAIEISLFDCMTELMGQPIYFESSGGDDILHRTGASHATIAPYGPYPSADGEVVVAVQNDREWSRFCDRILEAPALRDDPRFKTNVARTANRPELERLVSAITSKLSTVELQKRLGDARIAHGLINAPADVRRHPALVGRDRWSAIDNGDQELDVFVPPFVDPVASEAMGPVPRLGQHTQAILDEIGFDAEAIAKLASNGIC